MTDFEGPGAPGNERQRRPPAGAGRRVPVAPSCFSEAQAEAHPLCSPSLGGTRSGGSPGPGADTPPGPKTWGRPHLGPRGSPAPAPRSREQEPEASARSHGRGRSAGKMARKRAVAPLRPFPARPPGPRDPGRPRRLGPSAAAMAAAAGAAAAAAEVRKGRGRGGCMPARAPGGSARPCNAPGVQRGRGARAGLTAIRRASTGGG